MARGKRCENCGAVGVPAEETLCKPCRLERDFGPDARKRYLSEIARKGARESRRNNGLDVESLPSLQRPEDAEVWAEAVVVAVAEGNLPSGRANALLRALGAWRKAREDSQIEQLLEAIEEAKRTGSPEPIMELVK